ncbi:LLM class flavin-dependent oxidoreductase [Paraburkholderia sp. BL17N1]|uniref:LLM class flavin-dependent oxidoreductase n=1 Tax=Paraburkholderia sp. BL17N1 TaxID=1938798 RepID=UPI000EB3E37D|nr:LLM class flavin-dependent oxidoreductase [Paraburkholderia sp. BL17N1]RKR31276.1 methylenetetrahydromethanopterin reductase [Paraburkholderia sp. BL17N1]
MLWSVQLPGSHPIEKQLELIELADQLGFHAYYFNDEIYHYDIWNVMAQAAVRTKNIRLVAVTNVVVQDPVYLAQRLLTVDMVSNGRAEALYSIGSVPMLKQFGVDMEQLKPIGRLREAQKVLRQFLDTSEITFEGKYYKYTGISTSARKIQDQIPLTMGGIKGPKTFEVAAEISHGLMTGILYSREALRYAADHFKIGAANAGRDWKSLSLGAGIIGTIGTDGDAARNAARKIGAFYLPALGDEAAIRHGIDPQRLIPIREAFHRGDVKAAIEMTPNDIADSQILATGTPDEVVNQLRVVEEEGYNHICIDIIDASSVKNMTGFDVDGIPDAAGQLRLLHEKVRPAFS